jgi:hypothetical protein
LSTNPDNRDRERLSQAEELREEVEAAPPKRPFVEPEVSSPVDVLEATTFFVPGDSGGI